MNKVHKCDKDVHGNSTIFYEKAANIWWMEMGFDSCAVEYCPFCGKELRAEERHQNMQKVFQHLFGERRIACS